MISCGQRVWIRLSRAIERNGRPDDLGHVARYLARDIWSCSTFQGLVGSEDEIERSAQHGLTMLRQREEQAR